MKIKVPLADAKRVGEKYRKLLEPYCYEGKCVLAGSIRRNCETVGDIEIICQPLSLIDQGLFEGERKIRYPIYDAIKGIFHGLKYSKDGRKYKQILVPDSTWDALSIDLFIVIPPAQWGYRLAIATGPAQWNKYLVSQRRQGGAFPDDYFMENGAIYAPNRNLIEMPTEQDYFDFLGIPWLEPEHRKPPPRWVPF